MAISKRHLVSLTQILLTACLLGVSFARTAKADFVDLSDIIMVSGGPAHGLALKSDGTVLAWGNNTEGQLGNGTNDSSPIPIQVSGFGKGSGVIAISAGFNFSMALKSDGTVWTWGNNNFGKLGDGSTSSRNTPAPVKGIGGDGILTLHAAENTIPPAISAGFNHVVALKSDRTVLAWGRNDLGALGDNTTTNRSFPAQVFGLDNTSGVTSVAAGANNSMALKSDGTLLAWGNNNNGQLGDGSTVLQRNTPVYVCAVDANTTNTPCAPANNNILQGVEKISIGKTNGGTFSLAIKSDQSVLAWGNNAEGQLGDGTQILRNKPVAVFGFGVNSGVIEIAANGMVNNRHSLALKSDGSVWAWGANGSGQLGTGTTDPSLVPVQIPSLGPDSGVAAIAAGDFHCYALKFDGTVLAWGSNAAGQLGDGTMFASNLPVQTVGLGSDSDVVAISAHSSHSLALKADGSVWAWGSNGSGELGNNTKTKSNVPISVSGLGSEVTMIRAGNAFSLALKSDGSVWAWGNNVFGQLGDNTTTEKLTPTQVKDVGGMGTLNLFVPGHSEAKPQIAAGINFSMVLKSDGSVWTWGNNVDGQLGDGTLTRKSTPIQVKDVGGLGFLNLVVPGFTLANPSIVATSGSTIADAFALKSDGTVLGWGINAAGQLGDGTISLTRTTPVQVSGLGPNSSVIAIAANSNGGFAFLTDDTLLGWGSNIFGQLGIGAAGARIVPVPVFVGDSDVRTISGNNHSVAILDDYTVVAAGESGSGQLGNGTFSLRLVPTQVLDIDGSSPLNLEVPGFASATPAVEAGSGFSLALKSDGTVLAWGANDLGQLGDATTYTKNLTPSNVLQLDTDEDGVGDFDDNCPEVMNPDQENNDSDSQGDDCDEDDDNDDVADERDNCLFAANSDQADTECDGQGDACDPLTPEDCSGALSCNVTSWKKGPQNAAMNQCSQMELCTGSKCAAKCSALLDIMADTTAETERQIIVYFCNAIVPAGGFE